MIRGILLTLLALVLLAPVESRAQTTVTGKVVGSTCGAQSYTTGTPQYIPMNTLGNLCIDASGGGSTAVTTTPGQRTLVPLDISTVTTGGTAVTALNVGHRTAGGWLLNPIGATVNLCINEQGTASGTTSSGNTTCILPGQAYTLAPAAGAVSVITSDSSHPFSGMGLQ